MQAPGPGDALLVVDVQNDFLPGGALDYPEARRLADFGLRRAAERVDREFP